MIREIICELFDHKWDKRLVDAYVNEEKVTCRRCGRVEDFRPLESTAKRDVE